VAHERARQHLPALAGQFHDRRRGSETGIVEQHVEPTKDLSGPSERRPATTTANPSLASAKAEALPMPMPPPVTSATLPFEFN
jgi:hypothetical protein